jgi:tetratricopeptide (TPR) repeat protein
VALETAYSPEFRLNLLLGLDPSDQLKVCRRALQIDPSNTLFLQWFTTRLPVEEALAFVEPRLEDRPVRVEWHRVYQSLMEKAHPEVDLRPRYRQLVADQPGNPDALYLLGRTEPNLEECAKLYQQAAAANPPSAYAIYGLGFMALSEGRFAEACQWFQKALPLTQDKTLFEHFYRDALLANRDYDALLAVLQPASQLPGQQLSSSIQIIRVYAVRNNKEMARRKLAEVVQLCPPTEQFEVRTKLEGLLCCYEQDQNGYLKATARTPTFESAFLGGDLTEAERLLTTTDHDMIIGHGLLYLEAKKRGDQELAETSWQALLTELSHGVREEKLCGDILAGRKPLSGNSPLKQPIDPDKKRILLAVLAQRYPDKAQPFLQLAKQLDYHHDATSLCLKKVLRKPS